MNAHERDVKLRAIAEKANYGDLKRLFEHPVLARALSVDDGAFLVATTSVIPEVIATFERIRALHHPDMGQPRPWCAECAVPYPCKTIDALDRAT